MRAFLIVVLLAVAQVWLRPAGQKGETGGLAVRFPSAVGAVLLSGFRPVVVQFLYLDFERAFSEGRTLDAVADARLLLRVDPQNPRAAIYLATVLAYDLAAAERTPGRRLKRLMEGCEILGEAEKRLPADPRLPRDRAMILQRIALDPELADRFRRRTGRDPEREALDAWSRAADLAPGAAGFREAWLSLALDVARLRLGRGDRAGAQELLEEARERARVWEDQVGRLLPALIEAWDRAVEALEGDVPAAARALKGLEEALALVPEPERGGDGKEEAAVLVLLLDPFLDLALREARQGDPLRSLSLMRALHSIQALARRRLTAGRSDGLVAGPRDDYETRWREGLEVLARRLPGAEVDLQPLQDPWAR